MTRSMKNGMSYAALLLLLALCVRSMIPLGFMPSEITSKSIGIEICSGVITKTIFIQDHAPTDSKKENHAPCPFAPPVLADNSGIFTAVDYVTVAYEIFVPSFRIVTKTVFPPAKFFFAQGPPVLIA